jgi:hypothetical protein
MVNFFVDILLKDYNFHFQNAHFPTTMGENIVA